MGVHPLQPLAQLAAHAAPSCWAVLAATIRALPKLGLGGDRIPRGVLNSHRIRRRPVGGESDPWGETRTVRLGAIRPGR